MSNVVGVARTASRAGSMSKSPEEFRRQQELQDHGHELAGIDTGRMARFGIGSARAHEIKEEKRRERAYRDALDRLLATDPEYRRLYEELGEKLGQAEVDADRTIESIESTLASQRDANQDMRNRAPKIDGKAAFQNADGRVIDEDGNEIDPVIAATIIWPADSPSAEDYFAGIVRERALQAALAEWLAYRNDTLGDIRNRYDDREKPISKGELGKAIKAIEAEAPDLPEQAAKPADMANIVSNAPQALLTLDS